MAEKSQYVVVSNCYTALVITYWFIGIHYLVVFTIECLMDISNIKSIFTLLISIFLITSLFINFTFQSSARCINCRFYWIGIKLLFLIFKSTNGKRILINITIYSQVIIITTLLIDVIIFIHSNHFWYYNFFGIYFLICIIWIEFLEVHLILFNVCGTFQPPGRPQQKRIKF